MENSKYYTPEPHEWHVGLEYEFKWAVDEDIEENWQKSIVKDFQQIIDINHPVYSLRVKLLDREDIEERRWEHDSTVKQKSFFEHKSTNMLSKYNWWLIYREKENTVEIYDMNKNPESFYGEIKNISELHRLMKQLKIE